MPRGGPRPNSGRPTKAQAAEKARLLAEAVAKGPKLTPRAYLQGVLDSPGSTKTEKMRAAELLMKCPPEALPSTDSPPVVWNVWALPSGCQVGDNGKTVLWPNGDVTDPEPLEMFEPTPPLPPTPQRREPEPALEAIAPERPQPFETVEATPPANVHSLRPHERGLSFGARHDPSRRPEAMDPFRFKPRD